MIITISGLHGTGKSTIAKKVADKLKLNYYSTGQAFRELAKEYHMSLEDYTKYVEENPQLKIDEILDQKVVQIAREGNIVVDSQLGPYFLRDVATVKILLTCPLEVRVKRMMERDDENYHEKLNETLIREKSERDRFKKLYNIDLKETKIDSFYDLIVDTQNLTIEQVVEEVMTFLNTCKKKSV